MPRDPHHADAHIAVLAGLSDIYLHVDALHTRCVSFLNGGDEDFPALLSCADEVLRSVWWLARDSLGLLMDAKLISAAVLYTKVAPGIPDGQGSYDDEPRRAIASLEGAIGEVEQQIYGLMQSVEISEVNVRRTKETLLMVSYVTSVALERVEAIGSRLPFLPVPASKPISDLGPDVGLLVIELGQMYLDDPNRMSETESAYINDDTRPRTREIGQILHDLGGKRTMVDVHYAIEIEHGRGAAGMLRIAWSGIGLWMAH